MRLALCLLSTLALSACAAAQQTPSNTPESSPEAEAHTSGDLQTHTVDGREGVLVLPEATSQPLPLVLLLHGFGSTGREFATAREGLWRSATARGWIVSAPTGAECIGRDGHCWASRDDVASVAVSDADDVTFLRNVVADVQTVASVDMSRIYVVGFSNGGSMAHRLAAEAPEWVAAGASVAGTVGRTPTKEDYSFRMTPAPLAPVSFLMVKGLRDETFPYFGGSANTPYDVLQAEYEFNFWGEANGCRIGSQVRQNLSRSFPDQIPGGVGWMEYRDGCSGGTVTRLVALQDLGHAWPLAEDLYDADTEVLDFFDGLAR